MSRKNLKTISVFDIFPIIDSTNSYLLSQMRANGPSGWVCFAEEQTAGRGRHGKTWFSPAGTNIYGSLLWRFPENHAGLSGLSMAVGVMLARVLQRLGVTGIQLKWPNDILFAHRKLAGILIEGVGKSFVIGIGINLYLPEDADAKWISLAEIIDDNIDRNLLVGLLLDELLSELPRFAVQGLAAFSKEWQQFDCLTQHVVDVHTGSSVITGTVLGIDSQGDLRLEDENRAEQHFHSGEVTIRLARNSCDHDEIKR